MNHRRQTSPEAGPGRIALRLLALTALPVGLWVARVAITRAPTHAYVVWNLILAWLPLGLAWLAVRPGRSPWLLRAAFGAGWLLFLPNAPYLVTDLQHLNWGGGVPLLYDVVLLFSAALCGLALGLVSLRWVQSAVSERLGLWPGRAFGLLAVCAAGFGVYLGRVARWNSWDVLTQPAALATQVWQYVSSPVQHWHVWAFTMLFAALLLCAYWPLNALVEVRANGG